MNGTYTTRERRSPRTSGPNEGLRRRQDHSDGQDHSDADSRPRRSGRIHRLGTRGSRRGQAPPGPVDPRLVRRRDLVAAAARRRRRRVLIALVAVVLVAGAAFGATRSPLLAVEEVEVVGVDGDLEAAVRSAAGVEVGDPMVDISPQDVRRHIMEVDGVASAAVELRWPRSVEVRVAPMRPVVALVRPAERGAVVVAAGGRVVDIQEGPTAGTGGVDGLPVLVLEAGVDIGRVEPGERIAGIVFDALPVFEQIASSSFDLLRSARLAPDGSLSFELADGATLMFGLPEDVPAKLLAASTMLRSDVDRDCLATLDVREPSRPTITRDTTSCHGRPADPLAGRRGAGASRS